MLEDDGGSCEGTKGTANELLGLPKEDLDKAVRRALVDPPQVQGVCFVPCGRRIDDVTRMLSRRLNGASIWF